MSDGLAVEIRYFLSFDKFKESDRVDTKHCPLYIRRESVPEKEIIFTVHLPYECLREWCDARQKAFDMEIPCTFVQILSAFLYERIGFKVKDDCDRVEGRLRRIFSEIKAQFVGTNGTTYRKLCQKEIKMTLLLEELATISEVETELNEQKVCNDNLLMEKENLQER